MAHNVAQGKVMARVARDTGLHLATGHQRHYSVLYEDAKQLLQAGLLGQIHHIRAQWHRGNLPGRDSWKPPVPGGEIAQDDFASAKVRKGQVIDPIADQLQRMRKLLDRERTPRNWTCLKKQVGKWTTWDADKTVDAAKYGYESRSLGDRERTAWRNLIRWRLWQRTGGGLMAELGSHQLDAASIFISALRQDGKKTHPLCVYASGGRHVFPHDRDCEDHVYCMFEFLVPSTNRATTWAIWIASWRIRIPRPGYPAYDPESAPAQEDRRDVFVD